MLRNIPFWQTATAVVLIAFLGTGVWYYYQISNRIVWSMIHVSGDSDSGDAHVLELPNGHVILIDTGFERFAQRDLIPYLDQRGIDHIDQLVITLAHRNHYGGIKALLQHLDFVKTIYFNLPPKDHCDKESSPASCDYEHVLQTREFSEDFGTVFREMKTDDLLYYSDEHDIIMEVVYVHDGEDPPFSVTGINNTSALLRLTYGTTTVLFTGDTGPEVGRHLIDEHYFIEADIMTAPHHGVEDAASNEFLRKVNSKVLMVSNSARHWEGTRARRIRQFSIDNGMDTYVTGLHGNVIVTLTQDGFSIDTDGTPAR